MTNFSFLKAKTEYALFAPACMEAEKIYVSAPAMCAVGCRKALELAVKWVYAADKSMKMPYKDNLQSLIHEPTFRFAVDSDTWGKMPFIIKLGNLAVHTGHSVSAADAVFSLRGLFDFIHWVDFCYGTDYVERSFDETAIPGEKVALDEKKIREQESLLTQKDAELEALRKQVESLSAAYTASKQQNQQSRSFTAADLTVDVSAKTVTRARKNIELTSREFALLEYMLRNKGIVLTREMIENNLWNFDYEGGSNVVDVYVGYLRKKMDTGFDKKLIRTVWGSGWVLRED